MVCGGEFTLESLDLGFEGLEGAGCLLVDDSLCVHELSSLGKLECAECLLEGNAGWRDGGNHDRLGVAAKAVAKEEGQFAVAVGHMALGIGDAVVDKRVDD